MEFFENSFAIFEKLQTLNTSREERLYTLRGQKIVRLRLCYNQAQLTDRKVS